MISGPAGRSLLGLTDRKMIFNIWKFPYVWFFFWLLVVKLQSLNGINGIKLIKYNSLLMISGPVGCSLHGLIV